VELARQLHLRDNTKPLLPKGTVLVFTAWHDNTDKNPNNPDPRQWVGWGDRTVDEMAHAWVDVTYLSQADFDAAGGGTQGRPRARADSSALFRPHHEGSCEGF
jgi:hypothetical protein